MPGQIELAGDAVREIPKSPETYKEAPSLCVTNLSDHTARYDMQRFFWPFGHIAKIPVPCVECDPGALPKSFGFVNFCFRADAQRIGKLHRHSY